MNSLADFSDDTFPTSSQSSLFLSSDDVFLSQRKKKFNESIFSSSKSIDNDDFATTSLFFPSFSSNSSPFCSFKDLFAESSDIVETTTPSAGQANTTVSTSQHTTPTVLTATFPLQRQASGSNEVLIRSENEQQQQQQQQQQHQHQHQHQQGEIFTLNNQNDQKQGEATKPDCDLRSFFSNFFNLLNSQKQQLQLQEQIQQQQQQLHLQQLQQQLQQHQSQVVVPSTPIKQLVQVNHIPTINDEFIASSSSSSSSSSPYSSPSVSANTSTCNSPVASPLIASVSLSAFQDTNLFQKQRVNYYDLWRETQKEISQLQKSIQLISEKIIQLEEQQIDSSKIITSNNFSPLEPVSLSLRICSEFQRTWYTDRGFPSFTIELYDSKTLQPFTDLSGWKVSISLIDGNGKDASSKLTGISGNTGPLLFNISKGRSVINGIRFLSVSSKNGGCFQLLMRVLNPESSHSYLFQEKIRNTEYLSEPIQILSYRLFHVPKLESEMLFPKDPLYKVKGIGPLYAKRFNEMGILTIKDLSEINFESLDEEQIKSYVNGLRRDRGALTPSKLFEYITQAREIVNRDNGNHTGHKRERTDDEDSNNNEDDENDESEEVVHQSKKLRFQN